MTEPISVSQVDKLIREVTPFLGVEKVALADAPQRVTAEDIIAESDNPPFHRVTMDGIACRANAKFPLKIVGIAAAGAKTQNLPEGNCCFEAMTGASLPEGADCVVPVEEITKDGDLVSLNTDVKLEPGRFVHPRGNDIHKGELVLPKGHLITAPVSAALAANGFAEVQVARRPKVAVIGTGNELVPVEDKIEDGQVRRSNDYMVASFMERCNCERITRTTVPDDAAETEKVISKALEDNDIVILSGGVSKGKFDYVPGALEKAGVKLLCRRVRSTPGGPVHFGVTAKGQFVFAAPGNPISTLACSARYIGPFVQRAQGMPDIEAQVVRLTTPIKPHDKKTRFIPVKLDHSKPGSAIPVQTMTSGDFQSIAATDGVVQIPSLLDLDDVVKSDGSGAIEEAHFYGW